MCLVRIFYVGMKIAKSVNSMSYRRINYFKIVFII